ncbi:MAG: N-acetylmuramoyl-L-alanine amidase, partial [Muribaculaceae bacterium]|nr:N-acetylmuramoyl-L-alanine amidase [Muribaculaceae bacterium]
MNIRRFISLIIIAAFLFVLPLAAYAKKEKDEITIVLDPGHGGKDYGACENGAKEKDINLAVAITLQALI